MRPIVYLHGFASSARSSKARFFGARAAARGVPFHCPDLNEPAFATLTVTRMLDQVDALIAGLPAGPVALVGSSLGGFVALHAAARRQGTAAGGARPIERLVLLAPAVDLAPGMERHLGPDVVARWEADGRMPFMHYADNAMRDLEWGFMADVRRYDAGALDLSMPILIFQGTRDDTVDPASVRRWAEGRANVTLRLVDDEHQLGNSLEVMWHGLAEFLDIPV